MATDGAQRLSVRASPERVFVDGVEPRMFEANGLEPYPRHAVGSRKKLVADRDIR